jgi:molecular chaperone DnaK
MIDKILLVGGTSRIPLVQKLLASKYGANKIRVSEKPMLTVAEGAAILSHSLSDDFECPHCGKIVKSNQKICENCKTDVSELTTSVVGPILYTASHNYYVGLLEGDKIIKKLIIEKQTPLPVEETRTFQTTTNNQKIVKVVIYSEVENGETCRLGIGLYLINNSLPLGSEISFDFNLDTNENFHVSVYPKNLIDQKKQILIGRGGLNEKALKTMDDLIERSIKEFKKLDSEQTLLDYVSQRIKEIEESNPNEITDEKWAEIYYNSTEKFAEIQRNEGEVSPVKRVVNTAKALVVEFGDLLDPFDKSAIIDLIKQIESSSDDFEKIPLVESLEEKTDNYGLLNSVNRIPMLSERILNVPGTGVGTTNKAADINKLNVLYTDAKTKLKMGHIDEGRNLKDEAYEIIDKYKI